MKKVLGICGLFWSGKTLVWDYLSNQLSTQVFENSTILKDILEERWEQINRTSLIQLWDDLSEEFGKNVLVEMNLKKIETFWIIWWIRLMEQYVYLKEHSDFTLLFVDIEEDIRFERCQKRGLTGDAQTREVFDKLTIDDRSADLKELKTNTDYIIYNNASLDLLYSELDAFMETYK